ncbi:UTP--glucose-1-phosphate uridylyltransferase [Roseibacterium elongatum DSM 19469]|uniref:UTP--glucose-1-phosphate uridylyltransferase n=1 Tax=Roseicyclus elongatus DSM 19469 TaxID=1294273 RepID=W8S5L2_9RHOB|nr:UTP--glucose-1-phosphate uridylyltransferase [Roseibacterium elongatum]AHM04121.1 UTP--glucose-1-phosphate uridylyltransferase [Roseibacterium elongatum DSM 19469]
MTTTVRTAIFPVAGLGTRFLPATKATPKELLPVIDTPLIQYAIDEARAAGIERMVFVSHPSKTAIQRHVMDNVRLRQELAERGKADLADELQEAALCPKADDVAFTMQNEQLGLGHAVLCAKPFVLPGPVAVILPDDLILGEPGCLSEMVEAYETANAGHMIATMTVAPEDTRKYGILSVTAAEGRLMRADGMVEKPDPAEAPSHEAVVGRYILHHDIFDALETQTPGAGGEIQLTDAIARGAADYGLAGWRFSGIRFDCGSKPGMLRATLHLAAQDPEYAEVLEDLALSASTSPRAA